MENIHQIVVGASPDQPALVLRQYGELVPPDSLEPIGNDGTLGKVLVALGGLPDLLLAGQVGTTKLMEVQIHGDLVRASDGLGFRAFAIGDHGVVEQAKLFDAGTLTTLVDAALVWRLASIVVAQKHLSDISATLKSLEQGVTAIGQFQRDEQASKIESAYEYLRQAERALSNGERESAVRHRLEAIDIEMDSIQRHLSKIFDARLDKRVKHENLMGYSDIEEGFPQKLQELQRIVREHRLAGLTRLGALQMLSAFPGEVGLKAARADAIKESADRNKLMIDSLGSVMAFEVSQWTGKSESLITNVAEVALGQTKFHKWIEGHVSDALKSTGKKVDLWPSATLRSASGSDTPELDSLKIASSTMIGTVAASEREGAIAFANFCSSTDRQIIYSTEPTRCLVEWGPSGPLRIRQLNGSA